MLTQHRRVVLQTLQGVALQLEAFDLGPDGTHGLGVRQEEAEQPEGSRTRVALATGRKETDKKERVAQFQMEMFKT